MTRILVYSSNIKALEQLLAYSSLFDLEFQYCDAPSKAFANFSVFKPHCFLVQCEDRSVPELKFLKSLSKVIPVFAMTASTDERVALRLLDGGADYLVHLPCGSIEVYYQLKNFIRLTLHAKQNNNKIMHLGDLQIFLHNNQVMQNGELVPLTSTEFKLLLVFANNLNQIVSIEKIYQEVYPKSEVKYTSRALNMHISNLRHKLKLEEFAPLRLETKRGVGFGMFYNSELSAATVGGEQHE
ncbi:MAG: response regulator transcription factor [Phascolarctobacterium sp.]